jgi:hypothetical protein
MRKQPDQASSDVRKSHGGRETEGKKANPINPIVCKCPTAGGFPEMESKFVVCTIFAWRTKYQRLFGEFDQTFLSFSFEGIFNAPVSLQLTFLNIFLFFISFDIDSRSVSN